MKNWLLITTLVLTLTNGSSNHCQAQLSLDALNTAATINFDATVAGVSNGVFAGSGFQSNPSSGQLDSDAWAVTGWSNGTLAFGGTQTTANTDYTRGTTTTAVTTGGMYAFDIGGNIALGIQPGGSDFAPGTLTLRMINNTGTTLESISISYDILVRNDQDRSNSFNFSHSSNGTDFTNVAALDYTSVAAGVGGSGFETVARSTTISGLSIANGTSFFVRWSSADVTGSGSRDEFGLDNIVVTPVPEPSSVLLVSASVLGAIGYYRRRKNAAASIA